MAFQLSALGFSVGVPRANTPGVDLLVANQRGTKSLSIQVKTSNWAKREYKRSPTNNHWEWDVSARAKTLQGENVVYAFVDLRWGSDQAPLVFIVPSQVVAREFAGHDYKRNRWWLYEKDARSYQGKWDLIEERLRE